MHVRPSRNDVEQKIYYPPSIAVIGNPKISVIVAVMNGVDDIGGCISSVAGQTYGAKELIVIDGGSTDGTTDVLRHSERIISYWSSEPDKGISDAWNKGLVHATGDWVCFLGADDYLTNPSVLAQAVERLKAIVPRHLLAYGDVTLVHRDGEVIERVGSPWDRRKFARLGMTFSHQGVFHHRSLFLDIGAFDHSYRLAGDYEWLLRAISRTEPFYLRGLTVATMQTGGRAADDANGILVLSEYARAQRRHLGRIIPWALMWKVLKVIVKLLLRRTIGERRAYRVVDFYRAITGRPPRQKKCERALGKS